MNKIESLREMAGIVGDLAQVEKCDLALKGDAEAIADCLAVCRDREVNTLNVGAFCATAVVGDYLATYWEGERDTGSRCGWPDSAITDIRCRLARRNLTLFADDRGLVIAEVAT